MNRLVAPDSAGPPESLQVVVVAYGAAHLLRTALQRLGRRYPIMVVDNSSNAEVEAVAAEAGARYLDPGKNLGYAAGVNVALAETDLSARDVLLLNPDSSIGAAQVEVLRRKLANDSSLACVAPAQQRSSSGAPLPARWPWHTPARAWTEAVGLHDRGRNGFLSGAVLLVRGQALADVGNLDERFFLYAEDEDWQRRARRRGWKLALCPEVTATHAAGGTQHDLSLQQLLLHCATERYVRKWYGRSGWWAYRSAVIAGQLVRSTLRRGDRRRAAFKLARLYATGPDAAAKRTGAVPPAPAPPGKQASAVTGS
ncbi:MAG TPA: glycosyltransferase family 2 protein [Acidimicrobiales bacterium]|nr:glycosyltransferase family 2 protein [Acidimicrobiales bacterium]